MLGNFAKWMVLAALATASVASASDKVALELDSEGGIARRGQMFALEAVADIARGWHIHSNEPPKPYLIATVLTVELPEGFAPAEVYYPPPLEQTFAFAPDLQLSVYEGKLGIAVGIAVPPAYAGSSLPIAAVLRYQACNDTKCLPPTTVSAAIEVAVADAEVGAAVGDGGASAGSGAALGGEEVFARWLSERGLLFTLLAVALLGLGLNLTPCVYPLISVTVAYFGSQAASRGKVAWLAAIYVLGIALSFSTLGVIAALSGGVFGAALQSPLVIVAIASLMIVLALGSFGLYQLQPPTALMSWAGNSGGGAAGSLFMGLTMGIVAAPCVGPIVIGLLLFVGSHQDPWLGFLLFFFLAVGMGLPYLLLAVAAGSIVQLPRSGEWLQWTERLFGCILLALAAYFLSTVAPAPLKPYLLPSVIVLSAIYLGFLDRSGQGLAWFPVFKRTVGIAMLVLGVWIGQPVAQSQAIDWESLESWSEAKSRGRPELIDFVAEWCIPCREMDHNTYVDADVIEESERFRMVKADLTDENDTNSKIVEEFAVRGVPTVILRSSAGAEARRMVGYVSAEELLDAMRQVD